MKLMEGEKWDLEDTTPKKYKVAITDAFYSVEAGAEVRVDDITYEELLGLLTLVHHGKTVRVTAYEKVR